MPKDFQVEDLPDGSSVVRNRQGAVYARRAADAYYFDPAAPPLAQVKSVSELERFSDLFERWDYSYVYDEPIETATQRHEVNTNQPIARSSPCGACTTCKPVRSCRGFEQFLIDLMTDRDLAHAILGRLHQVYMRRVEAFLDAFGDFVERGVSDRRLGNAAGRLDFSIAAPGNDFSLCRRINWTD